jgi:xanthine/uracil permease
MVSTIETYGDTSATAQASGLKPGDDEIGKRYEEAIQGGLLGDAVNSLFSALSMVLPSTTLSQNIGIISLTNVAARDAGYACGLWMLIYGIFGKIGAFFTSIPQPVLGGMSTFLFANIAVSGIKVMTTHGIDRRARFIMAIAGSFGLGTILVPQWFTSGNFLDCPAIEEEGLRGACDAVIITLSTGYAIGCLVALVLNALLPHEDEELDLESEELKDLTNLTARKDVEEQDEESEELKEIAE